MYIILAIDNIKFSSLSNNLFCVILCADNVTVQTDGNGVQDVRIIVAFLNGCSVMGKMIAVMAVMSCHSIVQNVMKQLIFNAKITDVYQGKFFLIVQPKNTFLRYT